MSMNPNAVRWHELYEQSGYPVRMAIDKAMVAARKELSAICTPDNCDPAEELVAAMMKYVFKSQGNTQA